MNKKRRHILLTVLMLAAFITLLVVGVRYGDMIMMQMESGTL